MTAFAQNTRDEVRIQGDGSICGSLTSQPGVKGQTYVAECLTPWDVQSKRVFPENACAPTLSSGTAQGMNIQPSVLQAVSFQTGHSTGNGSGFNVDDVSYIISTSNDQAVAEPVVMASAHTNAEIGEDGITPTLIAHIAKDAPVLAMEKTCSQSPIPFDDVTVIDRAAYNQGENAAYPPPHRADGRDGHAGGEGAARGRVLLSNGDDVVGALCARDYKGVGSQFFQEGKVIVCQNQ